MLIGRCHCGTSGWTLRGDLGVVTACNCTLCRRYGALWAYDIEDERIHISGSTRSYVRSDKPHPEIEVLFCPTCASVLAWRAVRAGEDGRRRAAVNVRLAPPEAVTDLAIEHFGGLDTFEPMPNDSRRVRDLWF